MGRPRSVDDRKYLQVGLDPTDYEGWRKLLDKIREEKDMPLSEAEVLRLVIRESMRARGMVVTPPRPPTIPPGSETPPVGTPMPFASGRRPHADDEQPTGEYNRAAERERGHEDTPPPGSPPTSTKPSPSFEPSNARPPSSKRGPTTSRKR